MLEWWFDSRCRAAVFSCLSLGVIYVGSLYIWRTTHHRDHPSTIKKRFISVFFISLISPIFVVLGADLSYFRGDFSFLSLLGFRWTGLLNAIVIPLVLTMVLFLGPLVLHYMDGVCQLYLEPRYWSSNLKNYIWLRNHIVAPFSEEFTFRACMLPILVPCFGTRPSIFICPLFFGIAHLHLLKERLSLGMEVKRAIMHSAFQFMYTTVFGAYSAYLFLKTGHFVTPFVAHAFCNHMGFPDFEEVLGYQQRTRLVLIFLFICGLVGWICLLQPLTQPWLYGNTLYT